MTAGDIMVTNVIYISTKSTYMQLRELLRKAKLTSFALVESPGKFVFFVCASHHKDWSLSHNNSVLLLTLIMVLHDGKHLRA